ncbi:hypothetical protein ACN47E_004329 [Coniothyrium glycines]
MEAFEHAPPNFELPSEWKKLEKCIGSGCEAVRLHPPCSCDICETQYRPCDLQVIHDFQYAREVTNTEANEMLAAYWTQMNNDHQYLRVILQQHGNALLEWWRRRRPSGRKAFLEAAVPYLPHSQEVHADDQASVSQLDPTKMTAREIVDKKAIDRKKYRLAFLLPYMNIPMLAGQAAALMALLQVRTNTRFEDWAPFDNKQLDLTWACGRLKILYHGGCVVLHGPNYGKLTKWDMEKAHRGDVIGFPRAQVLLEAQSRLFSMLRCIVDQALERISPVSVLGTRALIAYVNDCRASDSEHTLWSSYVHQPFSQPPSINFEAMITGVQGQINDISDQLWLLQTEPSYMRRYLRLIKQMQTAQAHRGQTICTEILVHEIRAIAERCWFWQGVLAELKHTHDAYHRFRDEIGLGSRLPKKVNAALGALDGLLVRGIDLRAKQLEALLHERPAFSDMYNYTYSTATSNNVSVTSSSLKNDASRPAQATEYKTHRLWWCLENLLGDPNTSTRLPYSLLLRILDDHLSCSGPNERRKMDEIMYERFSDYAFMLELLESLRLHRPLYARPTADDLRNCEDRPGWRRLRLSKPYKLNIVSVFPRLWTFEAVQAPAGGRNLQWLKSFNRNHAALKGFWSSLHAAYLSWHIECGFEAPDVDSAMQAIEVWESDEYEARLAAKRSEVLRDISKRTLVADDQFFLPLPMENVHVPPTDSMRRLKVKTKGTAQRETPVDSNNVDESCAHATVVIELPKRTLSVVRAMFPETPQERSTEIEWSTFVSAMNDCGFTARNGGGSIVIFDGKQCEGRIVFHRPHPSPKIDPVMLQSMGRRMNKWFGWHRGTFILAKK